MKKDKIKQIKTLLTAHGKLDQEERAYYNKAGFKFFEGCHSAVIVDPEPEDLVMVNRLDKKLPLTVAYIEFTEE
jgi:hypothetical protein